MEQHREEQKPAERPPGEKPKRFRLIKLEERIAPKAGGNTNGNGNGGGGGFTTSMGGYSIE